MRVETKREGAEVYSGVIVYLYARGLNTTLIGWSLQVRVLPAAQMIIM